MYPKIIQLAQSNYNQYLWNFLQFVKEFSLEFSVTGTINWITSVEFV